MPLPGYLPASTFLAYLAVGLLVTLLLLPFRHRLGWRRAVGWVWLAVVAAWVSESLDTWLAGLMSGTAEPGFVAKLLAASASLLGIWAVLQVLRIVLWETFAHRRGQPTLPRLIWDLIAFSVMVLAVLRVLAVDFGVDLTALLVTSTVVSAVVGLAMQDTLRNLIAGIALQIEPPFSLGDWVMLDSFEGEVVEFNWRTLAIRTRENNIVLLPNGTVAAAEIVNFSRPVRLSALDVYVGVAYPHPPGEVKAVLATAGREAEGVSPLREPQVLVIEYADFAVNYRIRVWVEDWSQKPLIADAVLRRVWYRLKRADMGIPFPIRDVNLRTVREDAADLARLDREDLVRRVLRPLTLLETLRDDQIDDLAAASSLALYTQGEELFHEGDAGSSLYVVQHGQVRVDVAEPGGGQVTIAHRGPGEFFGEMSLLTGAPRSATIVAETETQVVIVPAGAVGEILADEPDVAHGLSDALAARAIERDTQLAEAGKSRPDRDSLRAQFLDKMRRFFGL